MLGRATNIKGGAMEKEYAVLVQWESLDHAERRWEPVSRILAELHTMITKEIRRICPPGVLSRALKQR